MDGFFANLTAMSFSASVIAGLIILLRPVTARLFSAKWQYRLGKLVLVFFLVPVAPVIDRLMLFLHRNSAQGPAVGQVSAPMLRPALLSDFSNAANTYISQHVPGHALCIAVCIWAAGAVLFAGWHIYCGLRFLHVLKSAAPISKDSPVYDILCSRKASEGIGNIRLAISDSISSPMLAGLFRPVILLPSLDMSGAELKMVLTHELIHLRRKDLWVKALALAAGALHWYNPLAYLLRRQVNTWGELSCDELMVAGMTREERKRYGQTILSVMERDGARTAFCSSLSGSSKHIERRLMMLLNVKQAKIRTAVFACMMILVLGGVGTAAALTVDWSPFSFKSRPRSDASEPSDFDDIPDYEKPGYYDLFKSFVLTEEDQANPDFEYPKEILQEINKYPTIEEMLLPNGTYFVRKENETCLFYDKDPRLPGAKVISFGYRNTDYQDCSDLEYCDKVGE